MNSLLERIHDWLQSFQYSNDNHVFSEREFELRESIAAEIWEEWGEDLERFIEGNKPETSTPLTPEILEGMGFTKIEDETPQKWTAQMIMELAMPITVKVILGRPAAPRGYDGQMIVSGDNQKAWCPFKWSVQGLEKALDAYELRRIPEGYEQQSTELKS